MHILPALRNVAAFVAMGLVTSASLAQTTRFVRATGDDSNSGASPASAWRTVSHAAQTVSAGATVYVGAGVYAGAISPAQDGTTGARITLIADTTGVQTGDAGSVTLQHTGTVITTQRDAWTFRSFTIDAGGSGHVVEVDSATDVRFQMCTIQNASSSSGMGVRVINGGEVELLRVRIDDCRHAVRLDNGDAQIVASLATNIYGDAFVSQCSTCELTLISTTLVGGGDDGVDLVGGSAIVHNCIFSDVVDDGIARRNSSTVTHTHNLFHDIRGTVFNGTSAHGTELQADPLFVGGGDYSLDAGSPAIDAGMDAAAWASVDYTGSARPAGGAWDIGSFEFGSGSGSQTPPIGWWRLDEIVGPTAPDTSGAVRHGMLTQGAVWTPAGRTGTGVAFDGGVVSVADDADLRFDVNESYSVSVWVYLPALGAGGTRGVVTKASGVDRAWGLWIDSADRWFAGGDVSLVGPIAEAGWTHVAVVQDGTLGSRTLYVNGVDVASDSAVAADSAGPVWFGGASGASEAYFGVIDDVRVWDRAIESDEVDAIASPSTYYVRTSGSNALSGETSGAAWRTIDYAVDSAPAGSVIYVGGGVYSENVDTSHAGNESTPTLVIADLDGAHTGDSGAVVLRPSSGRPIRFDGADYLQFRGFTIETPSSGVDAVLATSSSTEVGLFECTISSPDGDDGVEVQSSSSLTLAGGEIRDFGDHGAVCTDGVLRLFEVDIIGCVKGVRVVSGMEGVFHRVRVQDSQQYGASLAGNVTMTNVLLAGNGGRGLEMIDGSPVVTAWHLTVANNANSEQIRVSNGTLTIRNSIVESDGATTVRRSSSGVLDDEHCLFWNGAAHGCDGATPDGSSLVDDPQLDTSHRVADASPAIDAGASTTGLTLVDLAGAPRVVGDEADLGAFEGGGGEAQLFVNVTASLGFGVVAATSETWLGGWHWGDVDADGDLDAIVTGNAGSSLIRNVGEGAGFAFATLGGGTLSRGGALGDFDNDGDLDFYHRDERLYLNDGLGGFTDAGSSGFTSANNTEGAAAIDLDHDGWLDVALPAENGNWLLDNTASAPPAFSGSNDSARGFHVSGAHGNGDYVTTADVNGDGHTDLFYHYNGGQLFLGDGAGGFTLASLGVSVVTGNNDKFGSAWGDFDNDGDMDLFVPRLDSGERGYLLRNDSGTFADVSVAAGLDDTSSQMSSAWGDYDNDGDLDLYITTRSGEPNVLYRNNDDGTFDSVDLGAAISLDAQDATFVDYDNDGDLDLSIVAEDTDTVLLRNETGGTSYLKVRIIGAGAGKTNVAGVGTRVQLLASDGTTLLASREVGGARGLAGGGALWLHFGGVTASSTYVVRVMFRSGVVDTSVVPSATQTTIGSTTISQMLTVTEDGVTGYRVTNWEEVNPTSP
ncbi:MAG: FG-GAP-like repeat-containing protein [Planctomycetota bacterium]